MADQPGLSARRAALEILDGVRDGRPFDAALDRAVRRLDEADRRLAHELAAGVLRQQRTLDDALSPLVPRGWQSVPASLRDVLRLGAYQLSALDRVPAHAAVDTTVSLARGVGGPRAGGFVNAVLRRLTREGPAPSAEASPAEGMAAPGEDADPAGRLAAAYSHPDWLVRRWFERFGADATERLLQRNNERPALVLQPARAELDTLLERWRDAGIRCTPAPYGAGLVTDRSRPAELPGYAEGDFHVQDPAQALLAWYADLPPGAVLYDACAAPGGKSVGLGRGGARVVAADVSPRRARRLAENLARAGSGREHAIVADAAHPPLRAVDAVLLDAPCLGTGTFSRHPDARWRVSPEALGELAEAQSRLLAAAAESVAPGGLLVYATCSLEPEENGEQVDRFLREHPGFVREPNDTFPPALLSPEGDLTILPHAHGMDGAYAARLRRVA